MTQIELDTANADCKLATDLQGYYNSVNVGSDPAVILMRQRAIEFPGLGDAIVAAWLGAISTALTTANTAFASD